MYEVNVAVLPLKGATLPPGVLTGDACACRPLAASGGASNMATHSVSKCKASAQAGWWAHSELHTLYYTLCTTRSVPYALYCTLCTHSLHAAHWVTHVTAWAEGLHLVRKIGKLLSVRASVAL